VITLTFWFFLLLFKYLSINHKFIRGLLVAILVVASGYLVASLHDQSTHPSHYLQLRTTPQGFSGVIHSPPANTEKYWRYEMELHHFFQQDSVVPVKGRIHLYVQKSDSQVMPDYGDRLWVKGSLMELLPPGNPEEFDYRAYLALFQIHAQAFVNAEEVQIRGQSGTFWLKELAFELRSKAKSILDRSLPEAQDRAIALALVLGIKDHLDNEIKKAYATAGAMHVLAVSGLHVGIIYLMVLHLLGWMKRFPYGRVLFTFLLIGSVWLYALVTGLSASVMRAATMFSVIALKELNHRPSNIYNSLGLAALILLLYNPNFIYQVGFQLSFIAVFGIVFFYPIFNKMIFIQNWLGRQIWSLTALSLAAQLSTYPLSIYYFNQFPTYFLFSNLFVIPGAYLVLILALPLLLLGGLWEWAAAILGQILSRILSILNLMVGWIEQLPGSLVDWLYLSAPEVLLMYLFLVLFPAAIQYRSISAMTFSLLSLLFLIGSFHFRTLKSLRQQKIIVYEMREQNAVDLFSGRQARLMLDTAKSDQELLTYQIDPHRLAVKSTSVLNTLTDWQTESKVLKHGPAKAWSWQGKKFLMIDQDIRQYQLQDSLRSDILILANNAAYDLDQLPKKLHFEQLIIGGDYQWWLADRLAAQSRERKIPVHFIAKDGHWMLDLNKSP
jgi:competence protein ComEC